MAAPDQRDRTPMHVAPWVSAEDGAGSWTAILLGEAGILH